MITPEELAGLRDYVNRQHPGFNIIKKVLDDRDRILRGDLSEAEAADLIRCVVNRNGLTRAQVETACWEWQERTFGPRKTDGTTSLVGTMGSFDGTYPTDQEVVPGGKMERIPNAGGGV